MAKTYYDPDWEERVKGSLETAWKQKNYPHKFGGQVYYSWTNWTLKSTSDRAAKNARVFGYNARIVKYDAGGGEHGYTVFIRRKK